jgi:ceramide glucosyltransferase
MLSLLFTLLFITDRILKSVLIFDFFRRNPYKKSQNIRTVSLIQPITRGASHLEINLRSRLHQLYTATIEHIWICDEKDIDSIQICRFLKEKYPNQSITLLILPAEHETLSASKISKMNKGFEIATGDIFASIDDDIALLPDAVTQFISFLTPEVGAVFGIPCAICQTNFWSGLMSSFVNTNAMMTYIPATFFIEPYTITGHIFFLSKNTFDRAGGFRKMENRIDDDHELARRIKALHLKIVQTPVCYGVSNEIADFKAFCRQMKRWFVIPRNTMTPFLNFKQQIVSLLLTVGMFLPGFVLLIYLISPDFSNLSSLMYTFAATLAGYNVCYAHNPLRNWKSWFYVPITTFLLPLQVLWFYLFANNQIEWRGQNIMVEKGRK